LLNRNPIVVPRILPCLVVVPDKRDALQDKARIHSRHLSRKIYTTSIQRRGMRYWIPKTRHRPTVMGEAERRASAAPGSRSDAGAEAVRRRLQAVVRPGRRAGPTFRCAPAHPASESLRLRQLVSPWAPVLGQVSEARTPPFCHSVFVWPVYHDRSPQGRTESVWRRHREIAGPRQG
jgi:hypothetical protein